jgi:hypothetical protein
MIKNKIKYQISPLTNIVFILFFVCQGSMAARVSPNAEIMEDINIKTDRNLYISGETIWFKAYYQLKGAEKQQLSKILYVELMDSEFEIISQQKYNIIDGMADGMIEIPAAVKSDTYILRAYTTFMRNFPPESYGNTLITIINPQTAFREHYSGKNKEIMIAAEGGYNQLGIPVDIAVLLNNNLTESTEKIIITDEDNHLIKSTKPYINGLAGFTVLLSDTTRYYVKVLLNDGDTLTRALEWSDAPGNIITDEIIQDDLVISIHSQGSVSNNLYLLNLYSSMNELIYESSILLSGNNAEKHIPLEKLDNGLNYLQLTNAEDSVLKLKAIYKPYPDPCIIEINTSKQTYKTRERIELDLNTSGGICNICISVSLNGANNTDISLPAGFIANPQLMNSASPDKGINEQIKLALIIYNKYYLNHKKFSEPGSKEFSTGFLPEIRGLSVSGFVKDSKTGGVVPNATIYASVLHHDSQFHISTSDSSGMFICPLNYIYGEVDLFVGLKPSEGVFAEVFINRDFSNIYPEFNRGSDETGLSERHLYETMFVNQQLGRKFGKTAIMKETISPLPAPFNNEAISVYLKDYITLKNMEEIFIEIIPYTRFKKRKDKMIFSVYDIETNFEYQDPLILLDNIPYYNVGEISRIHPSKVDNIKIINRTYIYGDHFLQGIVMIETNTDNFAGAKAPQGSNFLNFQGITPGVTFPETDYSKHDDINYKLPDFRNTLYWNPNMIIDREGNSLNFYSSDHCGEYDILVQGYDENGNPCYGRKTIKVVP